MFVQQCKQKWHTLPLQWHEHSPNHPYPPNQYETVHCETDGLEIFLSLAHARMEIHGWQCGLAQEFFVPRINLVSTKINAER